MEEFISIRRNISNGVQNGKSRTNLSSTSLYIPKSIFIEIGQPSNILFKYSELLSAYYLQLVDIDSFSKKGVQKASINKSGGGARFGADKYIEVGNYSLERVDEITWKLVKQ